MSTTKPHPTGRARPRKERAGMAAIRGIWTFVMPMLGFAVVWLVDNFTSLGLPWWVALVIGSFCYGLKKYLAPDSRI